MKHLPIREVLQRRYSGRATGLALGGALALLLATHVSAREFRTLNEIQAAALVPDSAAAVQKLIPVNQALVDQAVEQIMSQWSTPAMQEYLGKDFYDANRLEDVIDTLVPRDAEIRILGVSGVQTLQQYVEESATGVPVRVSRVSVTVRTQLEYNDPENGLVRLPGTTEYILKFREALAGGES
jgi:hypothetical protein